MQSPKHDKVYEVSPIFSLSHIWSLLDSVSPFLSLATRAFFPYTSHDYPPPLNPPSISYKSPINLQVAGSVNNLAVLLMDMGRHAEAVPKLREAARLAKDALGPTHPQYATALNNLAGGLQLAGRASEAEGQFVRALRINSEVLGEAHPNTKSTADNLERCRADAKGAEGGGQNERKRRKGKRRAKK